MSLSEFVDAGNTNPLIAVGKIVLYFVNKCVALLNDNAFVAGAGVSLFYILMAFFVMWIVVNIFVIRPIAVPVADTVIRGARAATARKDRMDREQLAREKERANRIHELSISWKNQRPTSRPSSQSSSGNWNREKAYAELRANQQRAKADHNRAIRDGRAHYE